MEAIVSQCVTQYTLLSIHLANVHCSESLVWFKASGFCYTISTGSSLGFLSAILLLPWVVEILQLWLRDWSFHALQQFIDRIDVGMGRLKTLDLGLEVAELVSSPALLCPYHQGKLSSTARVAHPIPLLARGKALASSDLIYR